MSNENPRVFISYSHDNEKHISWVKTFAKRLENSRVEVMLDDNVSFGGNLDKFMEQSPIVADRVFVICSELYVRRANDEIGGVGTEKKILNSILKQDSDSIKLIPIIRNNTRENELLPKFLINRKYVDFRNDSDFENNYRKLIDDIFKNFNKIETEIDEKSQPSVVREITNIESNKIYEKVKSTKEINYDVHSAEHQEFVTKANKFIEERYTLIEENKIEPKLIGENSVLIVHLIPLFSFSNEEWFEMSRISNDLAIREFAFISGFNSFFKYDGLLLDHRKSEYCSYTKVFLRGCIEFVDENFTNKFGSLASVCIVNNIKNVIVSSLKYFRLIDIKPPIYFKISFRGMTGTSLFIDYGITSREFNESRLDLQPETILEFDENYNYNVSINKKLNQLWNAFGYRTCHLIDKNGNLTIKN